MFPPVHPALAYLLYSGGRRALGRSAPGRAAAVAVVVGGALPDLIDQPLYHFLFDLPSTRTLGHSLLFVVPICLAVLVAARRSSLPDSVGPAFAVGALSHPAADALWPLLLGLYDELGFLLWPITHSPPYAGTKPLFAVGDATVTTLWFELPLLAGAAILWWRDGRPGLGGP